MSARPARPSIPRPCPLTSTWNAIVDSVDVSLLPTDKDYRKEQPRTNSGAPLFFKLKFNSILFKSFQLKCSAAVQFDEHVLDKGYISNSKAKYDPETNSISVSSVNFNNGVNFKMLTTKGTGDDKVVATNPGDTVNVTGTITLTMGDKTRTSPSPPRFRSTSSPSPAAASAW